MSITISSDGVRTEQLTDTDATGLDLYGDDKTVVAVRVNGELRDLHRPLPAGAEVEPVAIDSPEGLAILRHSAAHVAAQAVQARHTEAKLGIGPPITDGFYYDFDLAEPFTPEDLRELEKAMTRIIKERQRFRRRAVSDDEARAELAHEPYKLELIADKGGATGRRRRERGGRRGPAHHLRQPAPRRLGRLEGPVPRPARAAHRLHPGLRADPQLGGLLARRPEQPAAAAAVRHRLAEPGGAQGLPDPAGRGGQA